MKYHALFQSGLKHFLAIIIIDVVGSIVLQVNVNAKRTIPDRVHCESFQKAFKKFLNLIINLIIY